MFEKPLEAMTDEELKEAYHDASDALGFVEDGWAMEPHTRCPSQEEVNEANAKFSAVTEEIDRREKIKRSYFTKPLEEMTDEELRKELEYANKQIEWVEGGWAREAVPYDKNYTPSQDEEDRAYEIQKLVEEEIAKRAGALKR